MEKVNALVDQLRLFARKVLLVSVPVAGVLIASDVLIGTSFKVLERASQMSGVSLQNIIVAGVVLYLISRK